MHLNKMNLIWWSIWSQIAISQYSALIRANGAALNWVGNLVKLKMKAFCVMLCWTLVNVVSGLAPHRRRHSQSYQIDKMVVRMGCVWVSVYINLSMAHISIWVKVIRFHWYARFQCFVFLFTKDKLFATFFRTHTHKYYLLNFGKNIWNADDRKNWKCAPFDQDFKGIVFLDSVFLLIKET